MSDPSFDVHKKLLGRKGERKAGAFLKKQKMKIVARNLVTPFGEIDIVAKTKDSFVFVEVKSRVGDRYGSASEAVTSEKQRRYRYGAQWYVKGKKPEGIRFDVIEVYENGIPDDVRMPEDGKYKGKGAEIRYIPNAF